MTELCWCWPFLQVAVVLPVSTVQPQGSSAREIGLAVALGACMVATTLNIK